MTARGTSRRNAEFSVEGSVVIHPGPVTTYEFKPDAGAATQRSPDSDDLCLAMQAESVLIDRIRVSPPSGSKFNPNRDQISMRELLESEAPTPTSRLTCAGQDDPRRAIRQRPATMPHLLIAVDRHRCRLPSRCFRHPSRKPGRSAAHHDRSQAPSLI
jgi:DNA segregation ATPase FtsK/SpoIIIE-like protein